MKNFYITMLMLCLSACVSKRDIKASIWLNNGFDKDACASSSTYWDYGFYRRLNDGKLEFIPYCDDKLSREMFSIWREDLERILNETLPEEKASEIMRLLGEIK